MRLLKYTSWITLIVLCFWACGSKETNVRYRLPENAAKFLSGTKGKTWKLAKRINNETRVNMGECTLHYRQTFLPDSTFSDNNEERSDCGDSMKGTWVVMENEKGTAFLALTSDLVPKIFKVPDGTSTKYLQLAKLTDSVLIYKFRHELYSTKTSIVTDILVPEDHEVKDRNFHW